MEFSRDINRKEFAIAFLLRAKADLKSAKEAIEKAEFVFERLKALLKERYGLVTE